MRAIRTAGMADLKGARGRFLRLDRYRVEREWKRYEGTAQRELFLRLRQRFLLRHARHPGWSLEVGPGPGRFSPLLGTDPTHRVLIDLSEEALRYVRSHWSSRSSDPLPEIVRGDAGRPPFLAGRFAIVSLLGNSLGFAGDRALALHRAASDQVASGGTLLIESVGGSGEWSRYLRRLPPRAAARLLAAPVAAVFPRIAREGFGTSEGSPGDRHGFRRLGEPDIRRLLHATGFEFRECLAVAPILGSDPERAEAASRLPAAWKHLLELEEAFGREPGRRRAASARLIAAVREDRGPPSNAVH